MLFFIFRYPNDLINEIYKLGDWINQLKRIKLKIEGKEIKATKCVNFNNTETSGKLSR